MRCHIRDHSTSSGVLAWCWSLVRGYNISEPQECVHIVCMVGRAEGDPKGRHLQIRQRQNARCIHRDPFRDSGGCYECAMESSARHGAALTPQNTASLFVRPGPRCAMVCAAGTVYRNYFVTKGPLHSFAYAMLTHLLIQLRRQLSCETSSDCKCWHLSLICSLQSHHYL